MSWIRVWIHIVFTTRKRHPFLTEDIRRQVFMHMMENAKFKDLKVAIINGHADHAHCLLALNRDMTIAKATQLIKGESSRWINENDLVKDHFKWQDDYWAVGVSESHYQRVYDYIANQEEHHKKETFSEEIVRFIEKYNFRSSEG